METRPVLGSILMEICYPGTLFSLDQWLRLCAMDWKVVSSNPTTNKLLMLGLLLVKDYNDIHMLKNHMYYLTL